jgi:hypothetical protein
MLQIYKIIYQLIENLNCKIEISVSLYIILLICNIIHFVLLVGLNIESLAETCCLIYLRVLIIVKTKKCKIVYRIKNSLGDDNGS